MGDHVSLGRVRIRKPCNITFSIFFSIRSSVLGVICLNPEPETRNSKP